jgi:hypothetical protein
MPEDLRKLWLKNERLETHYHWSRVSSSIQEALSDVLRSCAMQSNDPDEKEFYHVQDSSRP